VKTGSRRTDFAGLLLHSCAKVRTCSGSHAARRRGAGDIVDPRALKHPQSWSAGPGDCRLGLLGLDDSPAPRRRAALRAGARATLSATGAGEDRGNPFFAIQFSRRCRGRALAYTRTRQPGSGLGAHPAKLHDNVVIYDRKAQALARHHQETVQQLACLGNVAEIATLALVHGKSAGNPHGAMGGCPTG